MIMRALCYAPDAPAGLRLAETAEPVPKDGEALVAVQATSLNFGEIAGLAMRYQPGDVPGWDAAGVVVQQAADGSGPPVGARVVTFGWTAGWAERRAVPTADLAVVPDEVDLGAASTLPVAGITALQVLRGLGSVLGRRVLVTGAAGGVGRFAVQLAALAGAEVVASVSSPERGAGLEELGAAEIVVGLEGLSAPVHAIMDGVGGPQLAEAFTHLQPDGVVQWYGIASRDTAPLGGPQRDRRSWRAESFVFRTPVGADLGCLVKLLAAGRLDPQIAWRGSWDHIADAAASLLDRKLAGKAVLDLLPSG
jgi:NADPH:quinone reductase-like Zn-dependent oxidoreductase